MNKRAYYSILNRVISAIGLCALTLALGCNPMAADAPVDIDNALTNENLDTSEAFENSNDGEPNPSMEIPPDNSNADNDENLNDNEDAPPDDDESDNLSDANDNAPILNDNISSNENDQLNDNESVQNANGNGQTNGNAPPSGGNPNPGGGGGGPTNDNATTNNTNANDNVSLNENDNLPPDNTNANDNLSLNENDNRPDDNTNSNTSENMNDNGGSGGPPCSGEGDCDIGFNCVNSQCTATTAPDIELGDGDPFVKIVENGSMVVHQGFQGGYHFFMSIRAQGFSPGATVLFTRAVSPDGAAIPMVIEETVTQFLEDAGDGLQILDLVLVFISGVIPPNFEGQGATVTLTVTEMNNPSVSASLVQHVTLMAAQ